MTRESAEAVALALKGEAFNSGGNHWLVRVRKPDGRLVVFAQCIAAEYASEEAFAAGREQKFIEW